MIDKTVPRPDPLVRTHTESHAGQRMPPAWVSRGIGTGVARPPNNGGQGVWYAESTGTLRDRLVDLVASAREVLCISSFIIADPALHKAVLDAAGRGIRIYVLTATEQRLLKGPARDDEFSDRMLADHVQLLDDLALRTLLRSGEDLHAKYVLVDPNTSGTHGIIFTCNLATEGLTRNPELAIEVTGGDARDLFRMFLFGFWKQSKRELLEPGKITANRPFQPENVTGPRDLPCTFDGSARLKAEVDRLVREARNELWIASWKFAPAHDSVSALETAARRGVGVRLLTSIRPSPEHMDALLSLSKAGVQIRGLRYLHAKAVISDLKGGPEGLVMSANFDTHGLDDGYEVGIRLTDARLGSVLSIVKWWWESATHSLEVEKALGELPATTVSLYHHGTFEEVQVEDEHQMDLGSIVARNEGDMGTTQPSSFPAPVTKGRRVYYKTVNYRWTVLPPSRASRPDERGFQRPR